MEKAPTESSRVSQKDLSMTVTTRPGDSGVPRWSPLRRCKVSLQTSMQGFSGSKAQGCDHNRRGVVRGMVKKRIDRSHLALNEER